MYCMCAVRERNIKWVVEGLENTSFDIAAQCVLCVES